MPRPAMLVAMVTAPRRPLCATISDSRSTFSGLAFSSSYGMPAGRRAPRAQQRGQTQARALARLENAMRAREARPRRRGAASQRV